MFEPYKGGNQTFKNKGFFAKAFPVDHNGTDNCGCYIMTPSGEKIVYAIDFEFIRFNFKKLGINHFILECNHLDEVDKEENEANFAHVLRGHCALSTLKEFLRVNQTDKLRTVILTHLSETNGDPVIMKDEIQKVVGDKVQVYVARKGMEIQI